VYQPPLCEYPLRRNWGSPHRWKMCRGRWTCWRFWIKMRNIEVPFFLSVKVLMVGFVIFVDICSFAWSLTIFLKDHTSDYRRLFHGNQNTRCSQGLDNTWMWSCVNLLQKPI
jgi:hypothetical protein